eukprot:TRINITY_DN1417_c0_g1_i1.p1 TRINITY_DN1417_c0_g1~~TRINITY_DN1417_c0_g1_i1.p1  ORF type:complete len:279 (-),score=111.78 TRINITY_DN1417_c0_g1_i1:47-883(-)
MSSELIHYLDGKWVKEEDCKISVFDITVLRGYGVFDFLKTYNKKPFLLDEHIDRLYASAAQLYLNVNLEREKLIEMVHEGIKRSPHDELYIKLVVTGGIAADGITPSQGSLVGLFLKAGTWPETSKSQGIAVRTINFERNIPLAKSLNYMQAVLSLQEAKKKGASDVVYLNKDGQILEGTTCNFFAVKEGKLYTTDADILYGITRTWILKLAKEMGIEVVLGTLHRDQIKEFDEVFISSTTREIHPVVKVDEEVVGKGVPGKITLDLIKAFDTTTKNL